MGDARRVSRLMSAQSVLNGDGDGAGMYKYSLRPYLDSLSPGPIDARIKFVLRRASGRRVGFDKAVFLTGDRMGTTDAASRFLSITYRPIYEYQIVEQPGATIMLNDGTAYRPGIPPTRVWPAFGKHGGGSELLLTKGNLGVALKRRFDYAGQTDAFRQDGVMAGELAAVTSPVALILRRIMDFVQATVEPQGEHAVNNDFYRQFSVKIIGGVGAVAAWSRRGSEWHYSVSCACHDDRAFNEPRSLCEPFPEFSMWGAIWHDDEGRGSRLFDFPLYERFVIPVLAGAPAKRRIDRQIAQAIEKFVERLREIGRDIGEPAGAAARAGLTELRLPGPRRP